MPKQPRVTARELLVALRRGGWRAVRQDGSHVRLAHPDKPGRVTVAVHPGTVIKAGTLRGILDQAGMTVDDLLELL